MTKKKIALVAAMMLLLPGMAFATLVKYSTSGSVTGASFITYNGVNNRKVLVFPPTPKLNRPFGTLKVRCKTPTCDSLPGASLSITITQSLPGAGTGTVSATLTATFTKKTGGGLALVWTSGPATIKAGGWATIYTPVNISKTCPKGTCNIQLLVNISQVKLPVPEPNAELLLGLGMLGLMGLATASSKMISA